ncbi:MAG: U32 family peptidase [Verrucomicrobiota bacterium]
MNLAENKFTAPHPDGGMAPAENFSPLQYAIATSWSDALLSELVSLNRAHSHTRFSEIYGAHRTSITGHGRPAYRLPQVDPDVFERHVCCARQLGLRFNYVMNAPSFGGQEQNPGWLREVSHFLEYLAGCGVSGVTIAHPFLLQFVKREFPDFRLNVSLIAGVDTVAAARKFEDLGVDVINLNPFTINRDFDSLRAIRRAVRCELELYANIPCLDHCPRRVAHYEYSGRASQETGNPEVKQDPFLMRCSYTFLSEPAEFLRSPFIRPEDVSVYREVGMDIIKLSDRTESTEFLLSTARAYAEGKYDGNLFDLIFRGGRKIRSGLGLVQPGLAVREIPVVIENQVLNELGFIDQIKKLRGADLTEFYRTAAARAVKFADSKAIDEWREMLQKRLAV